MTRAGVLTLFLATSACCLGAPNAPEWTVTITYQGTTTEPLEFGTRVEYERGGDHYECFASPPEDAPRERATADCLIGDFALLPVEYEIGEFGARPVRVGPRIDDVESVTIDLLADDEVLASQTLKLTYYDEGEGKPIPIRKWDPDSCEYTALKAEAMVTFDYALLAD